MLWTSALGDSVLTFKRFSRIDRTRNKYPQLWITHSKYSNGGAGEAFWEQRGERRNGQSGGIAQGLGSWFLTPASCLPQCSTEVKWEAVPDLIIVYALVAGGGSLEVLQLSLSLGNQLKGLEGLRPQRTDIRNLVALHLSWCSPF